MLSNISSRLSTALSLSTDEGNAVGHGSPRLPGGQGWNHPIEFWQLPEEQKIDFIAARFAPEIRIHSKDKNLPSSVEWYLKRCKLCFNEGLDMNNPVIIDSFGEVTEEDLMKLTSQVHEWGGKTWYSNKNQCHGDRVPWYLLRDDKRHPDAFPGRSRKSVEKGRVPVYCNANATDPEEVDFQYWCFYPHNGPCYYQAAFLPAGTGEHQGDWEHVTVVVSRRSWTPVAIFTDAHGSEGTWLLQPTPSATAHDGWQTNSEGHPLVYTAHGGHGHYPWAGRIARGWKGTNTPIDDGTDDDGPHWKTYKNIVRICPADQATGKLRWLTFGGDWGRPHMKGDVVQQGGGPDCPSWKRSFRRRDGHPDIDPSTPKNSRPPKPGGDRVGTAIGSREIGLAIEAETSGYAFAGISVRVCTDFAKVWDDSGTGAKHGNISFYRPIPPAGYHILGDAAERSYLNMPKHGACLVVKETCTAFPEWSLLKRPEDFVLVWDTTNTSHKYNNRQGVSIWRPVPPKGYVALGHITTAGDVKPFVSSMVCVHRSLVNQGRFDTQHPEFGFLWSDQGSGARYDVSIWTPTSYDSSRTSVPVGTFISVQKYQGSPSFDDAWCLKVRKAEEATEQQGWDLDSVVRQDQEKEERKRQMRRSQLGEHTLEMVYSPPSPQHQQPTFVMSGSESPSQFTFESPVMSHYQPSSPSSEFAIGPAQYSPSSEYYSPSLTYSPTSAHSPLPQHYPQQPYSQQYTQQPQPQAVYTQGYSPMYAPSPVHSAPATLRMDSSAQPPQTYVFAPPGQQQPQSQPQSGNLPAPPSGEHHSAPASTSAPQSQPGVEVTVIKKDLRDLSM